MYHTRPNSSFKSQSDVVRNDVTKEKVKTSSKKNKIIPAEITSQIPKDSAPAGNSPPDPTLKNKKLTGRIRPYSKKSSKIKAKEKSAAASASSDAGQHALELFLQRRGSQSENDDFEPLTPTIKLMRTDSNISVPSTSTSSTVRQSGNWDYISTFLHEINDEKAYLDSARLLTPLGTNPSPIEKSLVEWEINFGLLYSLHQRTENPDTKKLIQFLITNYLAKAAFLNFTGHLPEELNQKYKNLLQLGQLQWGGLYHRSSASTQIPILKILGFENKLGGLKEKILDFLAMDLMEVKELFKLSFIITPDVTQTEDLVKILVKAFKANKDKFPDKHFLTPILIDITAQIGDTLITNGEPGKRQEYTNIQTEIRTIINQITREAAERISEKYAEDTINPERVSSYLKENIAIVSRAQLNDHLAVLGLHSAIFNDEDFVPENDTSSEALPRSRRLENIKKVIDQWIGITAIGIGGVNFRRTLGELYTPSELTHTLGGQPVIYAVEGSTNILIYPTPEALTNTNIVKNSLRDISEGTYLGSSVGPAQKVLAAFTLRMINSLIEKIGNDKWTRMQQEDRAIAELTQIACFRTLHHLADAVNAVDNFTVFSQAIDRTHAELATLLAIYTPFDPTTFKNEYAKFLQPMFPSGLVPAQIGVAKSAMNVFAGVNVALMATKPNPVRAYGPHTYYEMTILLGENKGLREILDSPNFGVVDLYVTEFYHNVDIDEDHTHYTKGTVIEDIKEIFQKKPNTQQLTVVIDATIDMTRSDDIRNLLHELEEEIAEGRLNIVVLRSGQKFDMMGLDNYYGGIFYVINNGNEKWDAFKQLTTQEAFQTDPLTLQYFTWITETAPELVDEYKGLIFDNTKKIMGMVPENLKPQPNSQICVCSFDEEVKAPFIDIKFGTNSTELRKWAIERFLELFTDAEKLVYVRGSFGFAHPNITWIHPKLRINPGIDPSDNSIYQQFFNELAMRASIEY